MNWSRAWGEHKGGAHFFKDGVPYILRKRHTQSCSQAVLMLPKGVHPDVRLNITNIDLSASDWNERRLSVGLWGLKGHPWRVPLGSLKRFERTEFKTDAKDKGTLSKKEKWVKIHIFPLYPVKCLLSIYSNNADRDSVCWRVCYVKEVMHMNEKKFSVDRREATRSLGPSQDKCQVWSKSCWEHFLKFVQEAIFPDRFADIALVTSIVVSIFQVLGQSWDLPWPCY